MEHEDSNFVASDSSYDSLRSYEIVQEQMRDLILLQQAAADRLLEDTIAQGKCDRENVISREEFTKLLKELEDERLAHSKTKAKLSETEDKLEFSLGEIEILQRQLDREKQQFQKAFDILKEKTQKETNQRTELVNQCSVLTKTAQKQQNRLSDKEQELNAKEQELEKMNKKLLEQKEQFEKRVVELNLERQQEHYISKVIEEAEKKRTKRPILKPRNT